MEDEEGIFEGHFLGDLFAGWSTTSGAVPPPS